MDKLLLLYKLDVGKRIGGKLNSLVKAIFTTIRYIDNLDDLGEQSGVKEVTSTQIGLELGATSEDQTRDVNLISGNEVLNSKFGDFSDIVSTSFFSETRETKSGLTTSAVFLGKVDSEFVDDFTGVTRESTEEGSVTVTIKKRRK